MKCTEMGGVPILTNLTMKAKFATINARELATFNGIMDFRMMDFGKMTEWREKANFSLQMPKIRSRAFLRIIICTWRASS